ncbi:hypothetical protein DICPUDRAFT_74852 [Dictyostelium purpureum]|uniref:alpha-mannosidase n=1 Tax=Dictyostelium purpureum TaxID=5786 RepID=F0Z8X7_DICPU|nr:uncharacterized protein DICPUDRAFT_74852 [Dictyostelium purpureum]EGC39654.1 hypothetical protein DICPUDRAFT_74852 [Dictyostelium purpureum]|eukprot:XP_003283875.1 hypothetical protein DICPUDRAFT_74852 [Dictyostelium purpureum]
MFSIESRKLKEMVPTWEEMIKEYKYLKNKKIVMVILIFLFIPIFYFLFYDNSQPIDVYLIPHSHCDFGKTGDYNVYNKTSKILNNVILELYQDREKTFIWAEINYFSKWYNGLNEDIKNIVKKVIDNKQLEFVSGGWVQNDDAVANVDGILEQITQGHIWLKDTFGYTVEYGWQVDSIGYSSITPTLLSKIGIKGLVINGVSDTIKTYLKKAKSMEFIWRGSETVGLGSEVMVTLLNDGYEYTESLNPDSKISMGLRVSHFLKYLKKQAKTIKSNQLIIPLGSNFAYTDAADEFSISKQVIEKILKHKESYRINSIQYSTLSNYFKSVRNHYLSNIDGQHITLFNKDFLPYTTNNNYWTGYYSNQPILKKEIRDTQNLLRNVESLYALATLKNSKIAQLQNQLENIRNEISLAQDHNIIAGTSKGSILKQSFQRIQNSRVNSYNILSNSLELILKNSNGSSKAMAPFKYENVVDIDSLEYDELYSIVFHNSLSWDSDQHVSIRVRSSNRTLIDGLQLIDSISMNPVIIQAIKIQPKGLTCFTSSSNDYSIYSIINIPALGIKTFFLKVNRQYTKKGILSSEMIISKKINATKILISSTLLEFTFDPYGRLQTIRNSDRSEIKNVSLSFSQYKASKGSTYIFKSSGDKEEILVKPDKVIHYDGPLFTQITLIYGNNSMVNCSHTSIIHHRAYRRSIERDKHYYPTERFLETSYSIMGQSDTEKVVSFEINSLPEKHNEFYTDNGIEARRREINTNRGFFQREKKLSSEANYYPVIGYIKVKDTSFVPKKDEYDIKASFNKNEQYTVYVDRTLGATFGNRSIEIMLHRAVGNSDQSRIEGKFYLNFDSIQSQKQVEKKTSLQIEHPPFYMVKKISSIYKYKKNYIISYSPLSKELPDDIHLQSFKTFLNNRIGLRLFNINNNDMDNQKNGKSNEFKLFESLNITSINETTLSFSDLKNHNRGLPSTLDAYLPIVSGESEYHNVIKSKNRYIFKQDNYKFAINQLEFKSFIIESATTQSNTEVYSNFSIFQHDNNRFLYDFSVLPIFINFQDDHNFKAYENTLKIENDSTQENFYLLTLTLIIFVVLIVYLTYKKKVNNKSD